MRKTVSLFLIVLMLFVFEPKTLAETSAKSFCVVSCDSFIIVSENEADEALGVAGLSKLPAILTLCYAFDQGLISEDTTVTVGKKAIGISGPSAYLKHGEQIKASELLRAAVMISAGDAITALMDNAFGSEDVFLQNINLTMNEIGLKHEIHQYLGASERFTSRELVMLGNAAIKSNTFKKYCSEKYAVLHHADGRETELANANKLLTSLPGCIGLITGSSQADGYCGIFACKRRDTTFICAVIGAPNSKTRFELATQLMESAFVEYVVFDLSSPNEPIVESYPVEGGDTDAVDLFAKDTVSILRKKSDGDPEKRFLLPDVLPAPLDTDLSVGSVQFIDRNGSVLYELALYPGTTVTATGFREILKRILTSYVCK